MTEHAVRDKLFDGVAAIAVGTAPLGFAAALVVFHSAVTSGALAFALIGVAFFSLGALWTSRKVTFASRTLSARCWLGERTVQSDDVVSIRVKSSAFTATPQAESARSLVVRSSTGSTITVNLRSRTASDAAQAWLAQASDLMLARWSATFATGQTVSFGKRARLAASHLEDGKTRIHFKETFSLEEVPGGPSTSALLYVSQHAERIVVSGDVENYLPLRDYLRRVQSTARPAA